MPRLSALASAINALPPTVSTLRDRHGHGQAAEPWRSWYSTKEWSLLRRRVFARDHYRCQMAGCGRVASQPIADHVNPHRGDRALFFADANVQTLCKPCHDAVKQRAEAKGRGGSNL